MATLTKVAVPDIGDFDDVPVVEIVVSVGDTVAVEDPLIVLESDKASMEVPSTAAGTVQEILVSEGDTVSEGTEIVAIEEDGDGGEEGTEAAASPEEAAEAAEEGEAPDAAPDVEAGSDADKLAAPERDASPEPAPSSSNGHDPVYASPAVRKLARELGVDLQAVDGSGRKGRILKQDVQSRASGGGGDGRAPSSAPAPVDAGAGERVALTRIQRRSRDVLADAWASVPLVTQHDEADITDLEAFRKQLNAEQSDVKITMVALLLKACSATLDAFPRFASSLDGDELVVKAQRDLGFAADTPNGLVVPVVRDVRGKGLLEIAVELGELSGKAREGKLSPKEMGGAVFTISSLGGIGGTGFTPLVYPPQVAILGVVRSATKPVWDGEQFAPRLMLPLSLSYDHRVIDGAAAARFCVHLAGVLADLRRVLL